jgi:hypothetical protein
VVVVIVVVVIVVIVVFVMVLVVVLLPSSLTSPHIRESCHSISSRLNM